VTFDEALKDLDRTHRRLRALAQRDNVPLITRVVLHRLALGIAKTRLELLRERRKVAAWPMPTCDACGALADEPPYCKACLGDFDAYRAEEAQARAR
jgi:hypothetical protein